MTNRIDGPSVTQAANTNRLQGVSSQTSGRPEGSPAAITGADQANFTRDGLQMQELAEQVSATESIDYEKVSAIKQALANGNYQINAEAIASNLMSQEKGLTR